MSLVTGALQPGRYAYADLEIGGPVGQGQEAPLPELALTAPLSAVISALFSGLRFRILGIGLEYLAMDRLAKTATFSAKLSELRGEHATVGLVVFRGARLCARGEARVVIEELAVSLPQERSTNARASSSHMYGETQ